MYARGRDLVAIPFRGHKLDPRSPPRAEQRELFGRCVGFFQVSEARVMLNRRCLIDISLQLALIFLYK